MREAKGAVDHHSGHSGPAKVDDDEPAPVGHGEDVLGPAHVEVESEGEPESEPEGEPDEGDLPDSEAEAADGEDDVQGRRAELVLRALASAALVLSGVSLLASLVVVNKLRAGLAQADPNHNALLLQVNPWYAAAIGTFLAGLALLVVWGVMGLRRPPSDRRGPGAVPAGVGLAFAALAWAFSFYRRLE